MQPGKITYTVQKAEYTVEYKICKQRFVDFKNEYRRTACMLGSKTARKRITEYND